MWFASVRDRKKEPCNWLEVKHENYNCTVNCGILLCWRMLVIYCDNFVIYIYGLLQRYSFSVTNIDNFNLIQRNYVRNGFLRFKIFKFTPFCIFTLQKVFLKFFIKFANLKSNLNSKVFKKVAKLEIQSENHNFL